MNTFFPAILLLLFLGTSTAHFDVITNFFPRTGPFLPRIGPFLPSPLQPEPPTTAPPPTNRIDRETAFAGSWELVKNDSGVSAMHLAITHQNKAIMFDAVVLGPSMERLPSNNCRRGPVGNTTGTDCWAHSIELDLVTYETRPLKVLTDTWCSSGGFAADGTLISSGGFRDGGRSVRFIGTCPNCNWRDYGNSLVSSKWYATQQMLEDGSFIVLGGRRNFNYEFIPTERAVGKTAFDLPFLRETNDEAENNLYPFIHLSTDGNLFVFANNRSILLQPRTGVILREFPVLPGGSRNYPSSAMSALLPINLRGQRSIPSKRTTPFPAEVVICGGSPSESYELVKNHSIYLPALKSCGRLRITDPAAQWIMEEMPFPRTVGDMLILPNGDLLLINGAGKGCGGWDYAREPVLTPLLYMPNVTRADRWRVLAPTTIPRLYHSSSAVLSDASVLVSGSNPNPGYNFTSLFPTELRVEKFRPPYLDPSLAAQRPSIGPETVQKELGYAESFEVEFVVQEMETARENIMVTMYAPPFTTHGFSMNQRLLVLRIEDFFAAVGGNGGRVRATAPPSGVIAPPGWYMLFVVNKGVPSEAVWVHIQARI